MPAQSSRTEQKPSFVFNGTIKKLKAATMDDVPINDRTAIVTVNQVIEAPPAFVDYAGQDITVQIGGRQKLTAGEKLTFYTTSWLYGDSVAVRSLRQEPVKGEPAATQEGESDPTQRKIQRETRERFRTADMVISGKVTSVRLPGKTTQEGDATAAASKQDLGGPVSEHDPEWREAVIEVNDVHKGNQKKQVVLRFPASTDVAWYAAPKFHPGQEGYFLLHKAEGQTPQSKHTEKKSGKRAAAAATGPKAETKEIYTALQPEDYQPYHEPSGIKAIIERDPTKGNS